MNNPIAERNGWGKTDGETCGTCRSYLDSYRAGVCTIAKLYGVKRHWPACSKWQSAVRKEGEGK